MGQVTATAPLFAPCGWCGADVLQVRWDYRADLLIGDPRLDPVALDPQQVTACIIAGIPLWQLEQRLTGHWITSARSFYWPRRPVPGHIAPEHHCSRVWDAERLQLAPDAGTTYPDTPPF
ncbi:hypothetical protein [Microbacterium imperiale]|uniref:hypothetical protein n=1 Tax=Microbacterium imperiale TaxID=33884 RepID=UPI001AE60FE6|nr:hypothetical protein [Microbacterium imperiale]MBP2420030.1 hypothetical protein [Microbacterium imperiale]MDS0198107.1 hypothetical protein [Microbacterium imperiale]